MTDRRCTWSDADNTRLAVLWAEGLTAGQISKEIGRSRNAVIGRAHRLGLAPRASPLPGFVPKPTPKPRPKPVVVAPPPPPPPPPRLLPSLRACAWPIGHPKEPGFHFCEARAVVPGRPYCAEHAKRAYVGTARVSP